MKKAFQCVLTKRNKHYEYGGENKIKYDLTPNALIVDFFIIVFHMMYCYFCFSLIDALKDKMKMYRIVP